MIKKNKHLIWYENSMKLNNEGLNCQKKKQPINKRTQNKRNCNHKNKDQIQPKKIIISNY
jgi:hypothetical protein